MWEKTLVQKQEQKQGQNLGQNLGSNLCHRQSLGRLQHCQKLH